MEQKKKIPLLVLSVSSLITSVGYGGWVIADFKEKQNDIKTLPTVPVCYIQSAPNVKYTSIEKALSVAKANEAADTIVVFPGVDYEIKEACVLSKNDNLLIQYSESNTVSSPTEDVALTGFADNDSQKRKTKVTLSNKLTIEEGATLYICGQTGGDNPQGATTGEFVDFQMTTNGSIDCYGNIVCYGYIHDLLETKRTSNDVAIHVYSGVVSEPLVMYDWGSASNASGKLNYVFPINLFDLPNIRVPMLFDYGSKMIAKGHIYGTNKYVGHKKADGVIISNNDEESFIQMQKGASVYYDFNSISSDSITTDYSYKNHKAVIDLNGNINISSVVVSLSGYELDSKKYYLPISGIYDITVSSGTCNVSYKTKFMPGSELKVNQGSTLKFLNDVSFYQGITDSDGHSIPSYSFSKAANFINYGSVIIGNSFDGKITTNRTGASLIASSRLQTPTDCYEATKDSQIGPFTFGGGKIYLADDIQGTNVKENAIGKDSHYSSRNDYWYKTDSQVYTILLDQYSGETDTGKSKDFTINASLSNDNFVSNVTYSWECNQGSKYLYSGNTSGVTTGEKITLKVPQNSGDSDLTYIVTCKASVQLSQSVKYYIIESKGYFIAKKNCVLPYTLVLMANGFYKRAGDIKTGDIVISFNHETGRLEPNVVIGNDDIDKPANAYNVVHLEFSDGQFTDFVYEHGYFDVTMNRYVYLHEDDAQSFIGHDFICISSSLAITKTKLIKVTIREEITKLASPATANHLNFISDNMLSIGGGLTGLFNIFEYDSSTLAFDKKKMDEDIQRYGLLGYESFEQYFPKDIYDLLPCKYLGVSIGKGLITWKIFEEYVNKWKDQLMENIK